MSDATMVTWTNHTDLLAGCQLLPTESVCADVYYHTEDEMVVKVQTVEMASLCVVQKFEGYEKLLDGSADAFTLSQAYDNLVTTPYHAEYTAGCLAGESLCPVPVYHYSCSPTEDAEFGVGVIVMPYAQGVLSATEYESPASVLEERGDRLVAACLALGKRGLIHPDPHDSNLLYHKGKFRFLDLAGAMRDLAPLRVLPDADARALARAYATISILLKKAPAELPLRYIRTWARTTGRQLHNAFCAVYPGCPDLPEFLFCDPLHPSAFNRECRRYIYDCRRFALQ